MVLPVLYSFLESGYFSFGDRLLDALKAQLKTAFVAVAAIVAFAVYLLAQRCGLG